MTAKQIVNGKDDRELLKAFIDITALDREGHIGSGAFSSIILELEKSGVPAESSMAVAERTILKEIGNRWVKGHLDAGLKAKDKIMALDRELAEKQNEKSN